MAESGSLTVYPGEYDASTSSFRSISGAKNPVGKGSTNTTYAQIVPTNGGRVASYVYWPFDLSAIPENATIDSVSCSVAARMSSVSGASILTAPIQLFAGSVAKGSATDVYSRLSAEPFSLSTGTWTRAELKTCRLKTGITRNTSNASSTTYQLYFYGADLTVTYTYQSEKFMLKLGGAYNDIARVFKKVNGIWVEQTDLANVVDQTKRLVNGGEYVVELPEGYTRLEYIEADGNQYFNTKFIPTINTRVEADIDFLSGNTTFNTVFGVGQTTSNQFVVYRNGFDMVGQVYSTKTYTTSGVTNTGRNKCVLSNNYFQYGDFSVEVTPENFMYSYPLYLFALNSVGSVTLQAHMRLYASRIYDNGDARRYIPCIDPSGTVGLYDVVTGEFGGSESSTPFIAGPVYSGDVIIPPLNPTLNPTFTIGGNTYSFEEGMTWQDFVDSSYNDGLFEITMTRSLAYSGTMVRNSEGNAQHDTDYIVANEAYI